MALASLPQLNLTAYNGYNFPAGETVETTLYRVTPKYDESRRTVSFCEFKIGLRWYIANAEATDAEVQDMVKKLTVSGGVLAYLSRGFGTRWDEINKGTVKDVDFGPRPGACTLTPSGCGKVTKAEWEVTFCIPTCDDGVFTGLAEWNYTVGYAIDGDGLTTRTISGHIVIANNRLAPGSRRVKDSADNYRAAVTPALQVGFKRESQNFTLSTDRSRLNYEVVDKELGANTPGPGLTSASATESIVNEGAGNLVSWVKTLSGKYTVAPGQNVKVAWDSFFATLRDRIAESNRWIPGCALVPVTFSATDPNLYGGRQQVEMTMVYRVVNATLPSALAATGIWKPVPGSDYRTWAASTADVFDARGSAELRFDIGKDELVDLCRRTQISEPITPIGAVFGGAYGIASGVAATGPSRIPAALTSFVGLGVRAFGSPILAAASGIASGISTGVAAVPPGVFPAPVAAASWLRYEVFTRIVVDSGAVVGRTLPTSALTRDAGAAQWDAGKPVLPTGQVSNFLPKVSVALQGSQSGGETYIQHRVKPTVHVYLTGRAIRYGYEIPHPQLVSVGGHPATLVTSNSPDEGFTSGIVGSAGYPVVGARWNLHYVVPGLERGFTLPNPLMA